MHTSSSHVDAVLCGNGGECNPINTVENAFQCDCLDGFEGNSCESSKEN